MRAAIDRDGEGQRALLGDYQRAARNAFAAASELYRQSWEAAPPASYGRLVGMLKAAVLAGSGEPQANYVRAALAGEQESSPTASYAVAVAALIAGDDVEARKRAEGMRAGAEGMRAGADAFARTADAIAALADRDPDAYSRSVETIIADFEAREQHLTGVAVADTALMLERLAARRGPAAGRVKWIEADIRRHEFGRQFDLWHDRAVFHFMVAPEDRDGYLKTLRRTLRPGGHLILAIFGPAGPAQCSGLPVARYGAAE